jgi:hypothetical protein
MRDEERRLYTRAAGQKHPQSACGKIGKTVCKNAVDKKKPARTRARFAGTYSSVLD